MKLNSILRITFLVLLANFTYGQSSDRFTIKHYTSKNGLPQNSIRSMLLDDNRFLWMTTEGGLVRFDGQNFKVYNHYTEPSILNDRFATVVKSMEGKYYTYEQASTVFEIKNGGIQLLQPGNKTKQPSVTFKGSVANLSFLSKNIEKSFPGIDYNEIINGQLVTIPISSNSYSVVLRNCVRVFENGNVIGQISTDGIAIASIFPLNGNIYFVNDDNEFFRIDIQDNVIEKVNTSGELSKLNPQIFNFTKSIFWNSGLPQVHIKINSNLYELHSDNSGNNLSIKLITSSLPENVIITSVIFDSKSQNLLIGTETKGLFIFRKNKIKTVVYNQPSNIHNNSYYSLCEIDSGVVMSWQNMEFTIDQARTLRIPANNVSHEFLLKDSLNNVWYGKGDTIVSYNLSSGKSNKLSSSPEMTYYKIFMDGDSLMVAGSHGIGSIKSDKYSHVCNYDAYNPQARIEDIIRGPDGNIWVSTCSGVNIQNLSNCQTVPVAGLQNICARILFSYKDYVFIGTYGDGYYVWQNGKTVKLPNDNGNYLTHVHSFLVDEKGRLWLSTNKGLLNTRFGNIEKFIKDSNFKFTYQVYGEDDGILNSEFNGGCSPSVLRLSTGFVAYPTMEGIVFIKPEDISDEYPDETIVVDGVFIDESPADLSSLTIPSNHESIRLSFSAPYWGNPLNLNLEYKLEGFNKGWISLPTRANNVSFSNLSSGKYTFKIRKLTGSESNPYIETKINFTVEKKYYETAWFILLCMLGSILLFYTLLKLNSRRITKKNVELEKKISERTSELQEAKHDLEINFDQLAQKEQFLRESINVKNRLISVISHDIITPLKFISMVSRISKKNPEITDRKKLIESMKDIEFTSDKLYNNASNILNWMKFQNNRITPKMDHIALHDFIEELTEPLKGMAENKGIQIENLVPEEDLIVSDRNILMIVLQNLLTNAIKYTEKGKIQFKGISENTHYSITVSDTGIGMNQTTLDEIVKIKLSIGQHSLQKPDNETGNQLGYYIITDFLNLLNGTFDVSSSVDKGTEVTIRLGQGFGS